jgi:hypothetical protein
MDRHHHNAQHGVADLASPDEGQYATAGLAHHDTVGPAPLGVAAHSPSTKDETTGLASGGGSGGQSKTECLIFDQVEAQCKKFSTLRESLALKGWGLRQKDGAWWITNESAAAVPLAREQGVQA